MPKDCTRNNGEVVVKTKDQLRSLALGPPGCPCTFGYRGAKHVMVIAGSTGGSIPEQFGCTSGQQRGKEPCCIVLIIVHHT